LFSLSGEYKQAREQLPAATIPSDAEANTKMSTKPKKKNHKLPETPSSAPSTSQPKSSGPTTLSPSISHNVIETTSQVSSSILSNDGSAFPSSLPCTTLGLGTFIQQQILEPEAQNYNQLNSYNFEDSGDYDNLYDMDRFGSQNMRPGFSQEIPNLARIVSKLDSCKFL
jgi:hypothetical protein